MPRAFLVAIKSSPAVFLQNKAAQRAKSRVWHQQDWQVKLEWHLAHNKLTFCIWRYAKAPLTEANPWIKFKP
jgi:hypothetical protein